MQEGSEVRLEVGRQRQFYVYSNSSCIALYSCEVNYGLFFNGKVAGG